MSLISIIKGILNLQKKIEVKKLPSQGIFYSDDFEISIKRADIEDVIEYEYKYDREDIGLVIQRLKSIVEKNVILSKGYKYIDIKSIDIIFIFLEIVRFTNSKPVNLYYFNDLKGVEEQIEFNSDTFNYFELDKALKEKYNEETKEIVIDGFRYSVPCIGVENSLTHFLISKSNDKSYSQYSYDFIYFLGNKSSLSFEEIENLIQIFNFDIEESDQKKIRKIVEDLSVIGKYSLRKNSQIIDVTAKIDLGTIWK